MTEHPGYEGGKESKKGRFSPTRGEQMPTFNPLFNIKYYVHRFGDIKLFNEVTLFQLFGALVAAAVVWLVFSLFLPTRYAVAVAIATALVTPRGIAVAEDAGRSPLLEGWAIFTWLIGTKIYLGAQPIKGRHCEAVEQMIEEEELLIGEQRKTAASVMGEHGGRSFSLLFGRIAGFFRGGTLKPRRGQVIGGGRAANRPRLGGIGLIGSVSHRRGSKGPAMQRRPSVYERPGSVYELE